MKKRNPYIHVGETGLERDRIVKSLSGRGSVHRLMGTLNSYFGIEFEFVGLFYGNVGLKMFKMDDGEKIPVFFVNSDVMKDANPHAADQTACFGCAYKFGHVYDGKSLSTFGRDAFRAAESLMFCMEEGGFLFNGRSVFGNIPPFSSLTELSMKLKLAGLEKGRGRGV